MGQGEAVLAMLDEIEARALGELDRFERADPKAITAVFDRPLDDLIVIAYREFHEWDRTDERWAPAWARFLGLITARRQLAVTALLAARGNHG